MQQYIKEADYWSSWVLYFVGLKFIFAGLVLYFLALTSWHMHFRSQWVCIPAMVVLLIWGIIEVLAYTKYPDSDKPFSDLFRRPKSAAQRADEGARKTSLPEG